MRYHYLTMDVFTAHRFGGNQLAVLPEADGLPGDLMQQIANEFGFSETTFVLSPDDPANDRRVRIFTPQAEVPFAGHPNIGTAFALAATGRLDPGQADVVFEEGAGPVRVAIGWEHGQPTTCTLTAPQPLHLGPVADPAAVAASLGLSPGVVVTSTHRPQTASVGLPFLFVEVGDRAALASATVRPDEHLALMAAAGAEGIHVYTRDTGDPAIDLQARMYAPLHGVAEDPATGSANLALAGLLATTSAETDTTLGWQIAQGVEMGRPSRLQATAIKRAGQVETIQITGRSVLVAEGWIEVGENG